MPGEPSCQTGRRLSRRQLMQASLAALGVGSLGAGLYTWLIEPEWLEVVTREMPLAGLPPSLEGRTLLHLSDLHVGPRVDDDYLRRAFALARRLQPDFVAMTGDWLTYRGDAQLAQLARLLEAFPPGRIGTVGILGNHDYGFGWRMAEVGDRVAELAASAGVRVLRNEAILIEGLQFLGVDDLWGPHFAPQQTLARMAHGPATVALCHNPDSADHPSWAGYGGWILAGHTHGGQCRPPFLPPPLLPVRNRRYTSGVLRADGGQMLHISRGVGYMIRVRFNVRPELTLFTLRAAPDGGPRPAES